MLENSEKMFKDLFNKIESALVDSKLIRSFDFSKLEFDDINEKTLLSIIETPSELFIDDSNNRIYIIDSNGDRIYCPEPEEGVKNSAEWLVDKLPEPTFSFDQGGNVRMSEEAEAIYQVVVVSKIFNGIYKDVIEEIINSNYDFTNLTPNSTQSFSDLLKDIQDLQSMDLNSVLSACQIKISNVKKKLENYFVDLLTKEEIIKLEEIDLKRKEINVRFEKSGKGTKDLRDKSKIAVLEIINEREDAYSKLFAEYPYYSKLWKIRHLSSEYIPTISKARIRRICEQEVATSLKEKLISNEDWIIREFTKRSIRKAYKAVLISIKEKEIIKCQTDKENYSVPLKR